MSAISQRFEASKRHRSLWDGIPKPKPREKSPLRSFLTASPPPTSISGIPRTPSPLQTDPSHAINVEVSPLPSPLLGPRLEVDPLATPGARTNAFFESSWRSTIPKPVPAFTLHQKSSSTETQPTSSSSSISTNSEPIDIILDSGAPQDNHDDHNLIEPSTPPRSQTIDFFNSPSRFVPSPPRSLRQFSPPDEKPDSAAALRLQLARLSPALAQADVPRGIDESDRGSRSRSSSHSSAYGFTFPKPSRDLAFWQPESSDLSRSSSRSSVSGVRRDFGFTTYDPQASYSPPKYNPSSPLSRLRELDDTPIAESPIDVLTPKPEFLDNHPLPTGHNRDHSLVRRETHRQGQHEKELVPGMTIGDDAPLSLVKLLGQGAFSSVWLARDAEDRLIPPGPRQRRRKSVSTARKEGDTLPGIRPAPQATKRLGVLNEFDGEGAILPDTLPEKRTRPLHLPGTTGQLVAVKMLDVKLCEVNDRTRISFVREVEVLRHISHPSIVAFLHSFTTSTHHCLVLEYIGGGELFELINSDENHARLTTPMVRRMWGELCRAVGWLHGVSIVHRDIKLENIVLTTNPFLWPDPIDVEALPVPLVKLTDFGLARFIDPNQPMLTTRCGSESYAAPEIVTGSSYDGRQTDAWACGIVLYALVVRSLPFDAKITDSGHGARRRYLIRIAKGEYTWPPEAKLGTEDLRKVVARLLVRDPAKRAKIVDLWDEEFMRGTGSPSPPWRIDARRKRAAANEAAGGQTVIEEEPEDDYGGGMLVDAHDIDSIASQELQ